ncbi:MAG: S8 family serine peptidase [Acidobacteria bacterium]|nr:S8 family serine peptidase [Acidobacteriota bacterium]
MTNRPRRQEGLQTGSGALVPPTGAAAPPQLPTFFLRTKLLPPRPAPQLLPRPRLVDRLLQNLAHPVTLVTANAGSGKTTLVADFIRTHARRFVWYQLDHTDADPLVFLGYVTHGIKQVVPGFGEVTFSYMQEAAKELAQAPERAVDVLLNEVLDRVEQQLVLVLDDYHHLGTETPVHRVVDRLLAYLPDVMHVIIISRDMPPLALSRLRTQASLAVVDRAELLFTDEETRELFRKVFDLELTPEQLAEYRERTHGWITALQLVRQVAQRQALARGLPEGEAATSPDLIEVLRQSERDIFDYFAEEVFADETESVQRFLLRVSLLERVEPETCSHLYPEAHNSSMLQMLVRRNVFMTLASDGRGEEYRLHPLFRSFLQRRLRVEMGRAGLAAEHARVADYFLERGQWEQAMHHLLAAEDFERAALTIAERGGAWISAGALSSLAAFADALPAPVLEAHPRALAHRAEVSRLRDEFDAAQSLFRRAASLLHEQGDNEGEAEALHSLATLARRRGDCSTSFSYLDRAVELTDEHSVVRTKCGNTRGLCRVALGQWTEAEREFRAALQSAEERGDAYYARLIAHNLGTPAGIRGDFGEALRWLRRMLRDEADTPPMPQESVAHLNIARCYWHTGDFASCEQHLDRALECCQLFNMAGLRGEIFEAYGNLYRRRQDVAHAVEFYDRAARAYDEAGIELTRTELLEEKGMLALQMNDLVESRSLLDRLIEARTATGDEMGCQRTTLARGRVLLAQGKQDEARADLYPALKYFRAQGLYYNEAQAALALAVCEHLADDENAMLEHLRRAVDLATRYDYEYWLGRMIAQHPSLFAAPEAAELLPQDLREQLPATTAAAPSPAVEVLRPVVVIAQGPVADLAINMLGSVEIYRDPSRPFAADAWVTKRARDILCFIASRRHRRASKDTIIDTFWGEADFSAIEKNFHPTVSHIRKALNSNQPLKQNFLLYRDGDYQLNPEFSYRFDFEEFDRLVTEGDAARRSREQESFVKSYEEAVALYRGEFVQGSYDEWAEEQRSYYREQYLRLLELLASTAQKAEEWSRSLHMAQQILREDPFREDVHCMIMRAQAAQANRVAVREQYENLRRLLRKELGVEPNEACSLYQACFPARATCLVSEAARTFNFNQHRRRSERPVKVPKSSRQAISLALMLLLSSIPASAGILVEKTQGLTMTGADGIYYDNTSGLTMTGADALLGLGVNGIFKIGSDGLTMTGADGSTITGADGVAYTGSNSYAASHADGLTMTGADGLTMTGADGLTMTGADGTVYHANSIVIRQAQGLTMTGADNLTMVGVDGLQQFGNNGLTMTGADGLTMTGADSVHLDSAFQVIVTQTDGTIFSGATNGLTMTGADALTMTGADNVMMSGVVGLTTLWADAFETTGAGDKVGGGLAGFDPELAALLYRATDDSYLNAVVVYQQPVTDSDIAELQSLGLRGGTRYRALPMVALSATPGQLNAIRQLKAVRHIALNRTLQWNADTSRQTTGVRRVRPDVDLTNRNGGLPLSGNGIGVAVLDTGLDSTHADLAGHVIKNIKLADAQGANVAGGFLPPSAIESPTGTDQASGHGTFVAGIIAGNGAKSNGKYAGYAPKARLVGLSAGDATLLSVLAGFDYLLSRLDLDVRVVNCSFSANTIYDTNDPVNVATRMLYDHGVNVVFSAGNSGPGLHSLNPYAAAPWVIGVGALDERGRLADFSARGDFGSRNYRPTLVAPGVNVLSLRASSGANTTGANGLAGGSDADQLSSSELPYYTTATGTSFSAPEVAGTIVLMLETNPSLTPAQVRSILQRTATPLPPYYQYEIGAGSLNTHAAVLEAAFPQRRIGLFRATFNRAQMRFVKEPTLAFSGTVKPGGASNVNVTVPADAVLAAADIGWGPLTSTNDLALSLYDPSGTRRAAVNVLNMPGLTGKRERTMVSAPQSGAWRVSVTNTLGLGVTTQEYKGLFDAARVEYSALLDLDGLDSRLVADIHQAIRTFTMWPDGKYFRPSFAVTRSELAVAMVGGARIPLYVPAQPGYSDVTSMTTMNYVESAQARPGGALFPDAMRGGAFRPDDRVSRLLAAIVLVRAAGLESEAQTRPPQLSITDASSIPRQWQPYVAMAIDRGLISTDEQFNPGGTYTRADLAHSLSTLLRMYSE